MLDNLFWFVIGFALGFFFFCIISVIKKYKKPKNRKPTLAEQIEELRSGLK